MRTTCEGTTTCPQKGAAACGKGASGVSGLASGDQGPWLDPFELDTIRSKVPMTYVEVVPVRLASDGELISVGMLLRASEFGLQRSFVAGRVLFHETLRQALARHIEKDLGAMAFPRLPAVLTPLTVSEYFPTLGVGLHDPRQHAVALAYAVPLDGDPSPSDDALDFSWFSPAMCREQMLTNELADGHVHLLKILLASTGKAS